MSMILSDLGIVVLVGWHIRCETPALPATRKPSRKKMPPMNLADSVALVTGANRGLGACLVTELLRTGAGKVYATSRAGMAAAGDDPRVRPLRP